MKNKILFIGAGGHAKVILETFKRLSKYEIVGFIDLPERVGQIFQGVPVLGTDDD